jgi:hypothetical protein
MYLMPSFSLEPARTDEALSPGTVVPGVPGAEIREVSWIPQTLEGAIRVGGFSIAKPGALLQTVPQVGRFLITGGQLIEFVREAGADPFEIEQFLSGSARAALVHQRGGLPLHASCLIPPGQDFAVAISGHSGAGKSTLAVELVRRGWSLLGDDVTPLDRSSGSVTAWPSRNGLKLWRDACERLAINTGNLRSLPGGRDKYLLPADTQMRPVRLGYVALLERGTDGGAVPLVGPARLAALAANTYKQNYLPGLECVQSHFEISCQISAEVEMAVLRWSGPVSKGADLIASWCEKPASGDVFLGQTPVERMGVSPQAPDRLRRLA